MIQKCSPTILLTAYGVLPTIIMSCQKISRTNQHQLQQHWHYPQQSHMTGGDLPWETWASRLVICFPGEEKTNTVVSLYKKHPSLTVRTVEAHRSVLNGDICEMINGHMWCKGSCHACFYFNSTLIDSDLVSSQEMLSKKDLDLS